MRDATRNRLLRLLRVPSEPAPPPGDPSLVRTFRAAPRYFHYKVAAWALKQLSAAIGLLFGYLFLTEVVQIGIPVSGWVQVIELLAIAGFILQLPFSFALLRLDFELRWYILSDRSLRIREGILSVNEKTMTFANIQNISIRQNPLARIFGISTLVVRAAGGGSSTDGGSHGRAASSHEAAFEGISDAAQIRDLIRARVRHHRDAGLGDPDEPVPTTDTRPALVPAATSLDVATALEPANHAARTLLHEVAALRRALA